MLLLRSADIFLHSTPRRMRTVENLQFYSNKKMQKRYSIRMCTLCLKMVHDTTIPDLIN